MVEQAITPSVDVAQAQASVPLQQSAQASATQSAILSSTSAQAATQGMSQGITEVTVTETGVGAATGFGGFGIGEFFGGIPPIIPFLPPKLAITCNGSSVNCLAISSATNNIQHAPSLIGQQS